MICAAVYICLIKQTQQNIHVVVFVWGNKWHKALRRWGHGLTLRPLPTHKSHHLQVWPHQNFPFLKDHFPPMHSIWELINASLFSRVAFLNQSSMMSFPFKKNRRKKILWWFGKKTKKASIVARPLFINALDCNFKKRWWILILIYIWKAN